MVTSHGELKIIDFGFAASTRGDLKEGLLSDYVGTEDYSAPEINQRVTYRGEPAELFSCGVILFMLLMGKAPFARADDRDPLYKCFILGKPEIFWRH